jgi:NAD(P)-dependent dehydrogenase (short-subunit alcohol dehydrogenase family)
VNLFGHIAVTQALLPALVRGNGRVVNISSVNGKLSMAGYGPYASSKHAMEAVSDALRNELAPHGVQVVVVEPGGVKTEMASRGLARLSQLSADMTMEQNARYGALVQALPSHVAAFTKAGVTSERSQDDRQSRNRPQAPHPLHHRHNGRFPHPRLPLAP